MRTCAISYPSQPLRQRSALPPPPKGEELARGVGFSHVVGVALGICALAGATAGSAQTAVAPRPVTVEDIAAKPLDDLNLRKAAIAPVLEAALAHPYTLVRSPRCAALAAKIAELDAALGPDIDAGITPSTAQKRARVIGGTARSVIGGLIPFGGVIREISGANAADARLAHYIYAGSVRRAFLKGYAHARRCKVVPEVSAP